MGGNAEGNIRCKSYRSGILFHSQPVYHMKDFPYRTLGRYQLRLNIIGRFLMNFSTAAIWWTVMAAAFVKNDVRRESNLSCRTT